MRSKERLEEELHRQALRVILPRPYPLELVLSLARQLARRKFRREQAVEEERERLPPDAPTGTPPTDQSCCGRGHRTAIRPWNRCSGRCASAFRPAPPRVSSRAHNAGIPLSSAVSKRTPAGWAARKATSGTESSCLTSSDAPPGSGRSPRAGSRVALRALRAGREPRGEGGPQLLLRGIHLDSLSLGEQAHQRGVVGR